MKKLIFNRILRLFLVIISFVSITACSPKSTVFVQPTGDTVVTINITTSKVMDNLISSFAQFSEEEKDQQPSIFNAEQIKMELENQGLKVLDIKTDSLAGITAKFKIFQKKNTNENSFVKTDMKKGALFLSVGPQNINEFAQMLSEDDRAYLDALMAPVFTGENLTSEEYEAIIEAAYGELLAKELKKSVFSISVTCPKKVRSIEILPFGKGKYKGNKAYIDIPLSKLLCVQEPIYAEVKFIP